MDLSNFTPSQRIAELEAENTALREAAMHKDNLLATAENILRAVQGNYLTRADVSSTSAWLAAYEGRNTK